MDALTRCGRQPTTRPKTEMRPPGAKLDTIADLCYTTFCESALHVMTCNVKRNFRIYGGTHENNMRGGTHNTPNIVGFAKALELIEKNKEKECERLEKLRDKAINALLEKIPRSYINGPLENRLPNNINITISGLSAQEILLHLEDCF